MAIELDGLSVKLLPDVLAVMNGYSCDWTIEKAGECYYVTVGAVTASGPTLVCACVAALAKFHAKLQEGLTHEG